MRRLFGVGLTSCERTPLPLPPRSVQVLVLVVVSFGYTLSPPASHHHITSPLRLVIR